MHTLLERRHLYILLALLLLANSVLTVFLSVGQGADHSLMTAAHGHGAEYRHHGAAHYHDGAPHHDEAAAALHHAAAIDGGTDEHGHHFHVHLPAHALVAAFAFFAYESAPPVMVVLTPLLLPSLTYAPPVPPPNA